MIYQLQKKFILISGASLLAVFAAIFGLIFGLSTRQLNQAMDELTDRISLHGGQSPVFDDAHRPPADRIPPDFITPETKFSTRFFTVDFATDGSVAAVHIDAMASIMESQAQTLAQAALGRRSVGWIDDFRYRIRMTDGGTTVVFVDGSMNRAMTRMTLVIAGAVLLGSAAVILLLIIVFSKRAVKPAAESIEKQKQFITNANHELKTPLTLILTNVDIAEAELGANEWLDDIRTEGKRMAALIGQLGALTRMDEGKSVSVRTRFDLSAAVSDTASEFAPLAARRAIPIHTEIARDVSYTGDEGAIRRLVSILLDNAVKYCDDGGEIRVLLRAHRHPVIVVENSCASVQNLALDALFDRFYRGDPARSSDGGFGIGLSIAQAIVQRHRGEISAESPSPGVIAFRATLK